MTGIIVRCLLVAITAVLLPLAGQEPPAAPPKAPLTETQKHALENIKVEAEKQAAPVALRFAQVVKQIYDNMLSDQRDEKLAVQLAKEMKERTWDLLDIKGKSIQESVNVLTPEQKAILRAEMLKPGAPSDLSELIQRLF